MTICTVWGLFVRKSNIQYQSVKLSKDFHDSDQIVLNGKMISTNSMLMKVTFSRCMKTVWKGSGYGILCPLYQN